jgi:hypothetical protein
MFTFAGRQRYLECLVHYSLRCRPFVDKHYLCVHTANPKDLEYIHGICAKYPDYFCALDIGYTGGDPRYSEFFKYCTDYSTFYVKLDDDICWMEDGAIEKLVRYKKAHPEILIAFANTINNGVCNHLHQRLTAFKSPVQIGYDAYSVHIHLGNAANLRWLSDVHESFLENLKNGTTGLYTSFDQWLFFEGNIRFSINCLCMPGPDIVKYVLPAFDADQRARNAQSADDEHILSEVLPGITGRLNVIYGRALVSHFAFGTQRDYLEQRTEVLDKYRSLIGLGPWRDVENKYTPPAAVPVRVIVPPPPPPPSPPPPPTRAQLREHILKGGKA